MDPITLGILTNLLSSIISKGSSKVLDELKGNEVDKLNSLYESSILELEKKHPKAKNFIKRFIKKSSIKNRIISLHGGKDLILEDIYDEAKKLLTKTEVGFDCRLILNDFWNVFIKKLKADPVLESHIYNCMYNDIAVMCKNISGNTQLLPDIVKVVKRNNSQLTRLIEEKGIFLKVKGSNFKTRVGAARFELLSLDYQDFFSIMETQFNIDSTKFEDGKYKIIFHDDKNDGNSLKINYSGEFYKLIYPPESRNEIWVESSNSVLKLTLFLSSGAKVSSFESILRSQIPPAFITKFTLDNSMKIILDKNLKLVSHLRYNPKLKTEIVLKSGTQRFEGKMGVLAGDAKFLLDEKAKQILDDLDNERKKTSFSDIIEFKLLNYSCFSKNDCDGDFHRDGRIIGLFPKSYDLKIAKNEICYLLDLYSSKLDIM